MPHTKALWQLQPAAAARSQVCRTALLDRGSVRHGRATYLRWCAWRGDQEIQSEPARARGRLIQQCPDSQQGSTPGALVRCPHVSRRAPSANEPCAMRHRRRRSARCPHSGESRQRGFSEVCSCQRHFHQQWLTLHQREPKVQYHSALGRLHSVGQGFGSAEVPGLGASSWCCGIFLGRVHRPYTGAIPPPPCAPYGFAVPSLPALIFAFRSFQKASALSLRITLAEMLMMPFAGIMDISP